MKDPDERLRQHLESWLDRAKKDAQAANKLAKTDPTLALYLVQQSVEKSIKCLLAAQGTPYKTLKRDISHNSLDAFIRFVEPIVTGSVAIKTMKHVGGEDLHEKLEEISKLANATGPSGNKFRAQSAIWPNEIVSRFMTLMPKLKSERNRLLNKIPPLITLSPPTPETELHIWLVDTIVEQAGLPDNEEAYIYVEELLSIIGETNIRRELESVGSCRIEKSIFTNQLEWPEANIGLYILSAITMPHSNTVRYPCPMDASDDAQEAARDNKMGIEHYSDSIGAIQNVGRLAREAKAAVDILSKNMDIMLQMDNMHSRGEATAKP